MRVDAEHRRRVAQLHTDSHVLNALVYDRWPGTLVTGAQINADGTGRMDFDLSRGRQRRPARPRRRRQRRHRQRRRGAQHLRRRRRRRPRSPGSCAACPSPRRRRPTVGCGSSRSTVSTARPAVARTCRTWPSRLRSASPRSRARASATAASGSSSIDSARGNLSARSGVLRSWTCVRRPLRRAVRGRVSGRVRRARAAGRRRGLRPGGDGPGARPLGSGRGPRGGLGRPGRHQPGARPDAEARSAATPRPRSRWSVDDPVAVRRHDLVRALRSLPPRQREAVVLRFIVDLSEHETAQAMSCAVGTVKSAAARGLERLRDDARTDVGTGGRSR